MRIRFFAILLLFALIGAGYLVYTLNQPYAAFRKETIVDLPKGTSTEQMAELLQGAGVIRKSWQFLLARTLRRGATLQAGEYRFDKPASTLDVYDRIARGDVFFYELVVPEGKNIFEIAAAVDKLGFISGETFLLAARDPSSIRDLDPTAPSLEGYLYPNTYRFDRHITAQRLCGIMTAHFRQTWKGLNTSADVHRTVTLASLVEKEARVPQDRPLIASVFQKRLAIGMKLDCDPTTIYAALLESRYKGAIHRSDLARNSPYNTYRHAGLPPGPIANPGLDSIKAILYPAETNYLYFVLRPDGSGAHEFSESLAAHQAAIARYRRGTH